MQVTLRRSLLPVAASALALWACGSGAPSGAATAAQAARGGTGAPGGRTLVVHPGESIQAAVDAASPGDTIRVKPGTYHEAGRPCPTKPASLCAVVIGTDGLRLVGEGHGGGVVLEAQGGQDQGIAVSKAGAQGSTCLGDPAQRLRGNAVQGFTVRGFAGEGIFFFCVDDWLIAGNAAHDNGEYGVFPSHCGQGRVTRNVATGANDTGIYIGQSHGVRVDHNLAHDNVSGFEIENSSGVRLDHNVARGNTGGILTFTLPFLDVTSNEDNVVADNVVTGNNRDNTCTAPGDTVCQVPVGTGILALAVDRNVIRDNLVTGNDTAGIALFDFCTGTGVPPDACAQLPIDPLPDGNRIVENVVLRNGGHPDTARLPAGVPGADLLWSGAGQGNCWEDDLAQTIVSPVLPLPACP